jgi:hypothetical protein
MPLTPSQVANLHAAIESAVSRIPITMDEWGERSNLKKHGINDVSDFVFGYIVGLISNSFFYIMYISEGRHPTIEEVAESKKIISEWVPRIEQAILIERHRLRIHG